MTPQQACLSQATQWLQTKIAMQIRWIMVFLAGSFFGSLTTRSAGPSNAWGISDVSSLDGSGVLAYTYTLNSDARAKVRENGWLFVIESRLTKGSMSNGPAHFMIHGHGDRRFVVAWDSDSDGRLTATLYGNPDQVLTLTEVGAATNAYHRHELEYSPESKMATYSFDGTILATWEGRTPDQNQDGIVQWGTGSSRGKGSMNYRRVEFTINGYEARRSYDAGTGIDVPDPVSQGWVLNVPASSDAVQASPVAPDKDAAPDPLGDESIAYTFSTFAGSALEGGADGVGEEAQFSRPLGVALDGDGNAYVTGPGTIRKVAPNGVVTTIAGIHRAFGTADGENDGARLWSNYGIASDGRDTLYVTDYYLAVIRKITRDGSNWKVTTIAGSALQYGDRDGSGSEARFGQPRGIAVDSGTNIFIADSGNNRIRKIDPERRVTTFAGSPGPPGTNDGPALDARFNSPQGVAVDSSNNVYVADSGNSTIRKIDPTGVVTTIAGTPLQPGFKDGPATTALFSHPDAIAVDVTDALYVADNSLNRGGWSHIRKITRSGDGWEVSTLAGGGMFNSNGTGTNAAFSGPMGLATGERGEIYVADTELNAVRLITSAGAVTTVAGRVRSRDSAEGTGRAAVFNFPWGVAIDSRNNLWVTDNDNQTIRKITSAGAVSTVAGVVKQKETVNGVGTDAKLNDPYGIAVDSFDNMYVTQGDHTIRKVTPAGLVTTIAGKPGESGTADGNSTVARFNSPLGIAVDEFNRIYVADSGNHTIRVINLNGEVSTLAGLAGRTGTNDDRGTFARFNWPTGVAVDSAGSLFVSDRNNSLIRRISKNGRVTTVAGVYTTNLYARMSRDGPGHLATFYRPVGISIDRSDSIYITDGDLIRKVSQTGNFLFVSTVAGDEIGGIGQAGSRDGTGAAASFYGAAGIAVSAAGEIYVAEGQNGIIRKGTFTQFVGAKPGTSVSPPANGALTVILLPDEANGQWQFSWENTWHSSGYTASNLIAGNYAVEFRNVPGWRAIPSAPFPLASGDRKFMTNFYYRSFGAGELNRVNGALTVYLGSAPPIGAGWRILGDEGSFHPSGFTTNVPPGKYLIEFSSVSDRMRPPSQTVLVEPGTPATLSVNYLIAATRPSNVNFPHAVSSYKVEPYVFNGQLKSDIGYGSGVAVDVNVVLTAAHLVFSDQTRSYVSQIHWFKHRNAGEQEPYPLRSRGFYVLSGYGARGTASYEVQRRADLSSGYFPGQSTAPSRNLDVAAVYFGEPVAGGGYGGYLPSDAEPNTWLSSSADKMVVGYPVDGSQFGDSTVVPGRMYFTIPQPYPWYRARDPVIGRQQVYVSERLLSYPGNSGGPLYVEMNGYSYPAAVYLGTLFSGERPYASVARAIDSEVVNLITNAVALGDTGTNNTAGGVITVIAQGAVASGDVVFSIGPEAAVAAGAGWRFLGDDYPFSPASNGVFAFQFWTNSVNEIEFKRLDGWRLPESRTNIVSFDALSVITNHVVYTPILATSWTESGSGKWENITNWSDGAPFRTESVFIRNAVAKLVTLDELTSASAPDTLVISNLTVSAPIGSTNALLLTNTGTGVPLRVTDTLTLGTGGALEIRSNSVVETARAVILGDVDLHGGTLIVTSLLEIGEDTGGPLGRVRLGGGTLIVTNAERSAVLRLRGGWVVMTNGTLIADQLVITNAEGKFSWVTPANVILGSTNIAGNLDPDADGFDTESEIQFGSDPLNGGSFPRPVAPDLLPPQNLVVDELDLLELTLTATDSDTRPEKLLYSLVSGPEGLSVEANGMLRWTPTEAQGPGIFPVTVRVDDDSEPPLGDTNTFDITVVEVNGKPTLAFPGDQEVRKLELLELTLTATDPETVLESLVFELVGGPDGLSVNTNGVLRWTPAPEQELGDYPVEVKVSDEGNPPQSATTEFTITVLEVSGPPKLSIFLLSGGVVLRWPSGLPFALEQTNRYSSSVDHPWSRVTEGLFTNDSTVSLTNPPTEETLFFRLFRP